MHPDKWRKAVERVDRCLAKGGFGAQLPEAMLQKGKRKPPAKPPRRKKRHRLAAYSRLRIKRGKKPDAVKGPAPVSAILRVLGGRAWRCTVWRWRRRGYLAVLVAVGQAGLAEQLLPADVLALKLPKEGWAWVARWLHFRLLALRQEAAVRPWLELRPLYGPGGPHLRASVAVELLERGSPPWRAKQVARAGAPSGPWSRQDVRGNCGPRRWPAMAEPMSYAEWARPRSGNMPWVLDLFPRIPRAAGG